MGFIPIRVLVWRRWQRLEDGALRIGYIVFCVILEIIYSELMEVQVINKYPIHSVLSLFGLLSDLVGIGQRIGFVTYFGFSGYFFVPLFVPLVLKSTNFLIEFVLGRGLYDAVLV